ncbi:MAG: beta-N-acetylhexosaminidase [Phocaeicola sp.]
MNRRIRLHVVGIVAAFVLALPTYAHSVLIPKPSKELYHSGKKNFLAHSTIAFNDKDAEQVALVSYLNEKVHPATGLTFRKASSKADVTLLLDKSATIAPEGYTLTSNQEGVNIIASSHAGLFYGIQTLIQLMPAEVVSSKPMEQVEVSVPYCEISDAPEFPWRGLMLDVSRHWFTKEEVMKYIDQLAAYKMNVFHWHLTDDQGWRIEIKSRPELTQKASLRAERVGAWWQREPQEPGEVPTYGGYYTQEEIKEVLNYAAQRYVTVIPEIDVPGHSLVALVAYPELACFEAPTAVNVGNKFYTIDENTLCVGNPESFKLMEDVLREVSALFPSEYIHIGGDECWKGFWKKCPKCQGVKEKEGLANEEELQSYFIRRMEALLKSHGKKLIGWDEIHEGGLAPEATVMSWRGMQGGIDAAKAGHHVVMTPAEHCYLDLYQGDPAGEPDTYSMCRLKDSYHFKPVPDGVQKELILGGQGNLWTEAVPTFRHAQYMTWPRGWALSEVLWSGQDSKNWADFVRRVEHHFHRADCAVINYAKSIYNAIITPYKEGNIVYVDLSTELDGMDIYYTFDNTDPDHFTPKYSQPLTLPAGATQLRVVTYREGKPLGKTLTVPISKIRELSEGGKRPVGNLEL